jgi:hypothetical protein
MTHPLDHWRSDAEGERRGVWVELGGGVAFLVTRMGGQNLQALADLARLPQIPDDASPEERFKADANALASVFVQDWRGMPIPFSKADCYAELEQLPDLVQHLKGVITDRATFRAVDRKGPAGDRRVAPVVDWDAGSGGTSSDGGRARSGGSDCTGRAEALTNGNARAGDLPPLSG